jgi:hypothetical protein
MKSTVFLEISANKYLKKEWNFKRIGQFSCSEKQLKFMNIFKQFI